LEVIQVKRKNCFILIILFLVVSGSVALAQNAAVLSLAGDGEHVLIADSNTLYTGVPFTIEAWFNIAEIQSELNPIIANDEYEAHVSSASTILVWDVGTDDLYGTTTIETNRWYHVASVNDGTSQKIFLNGVLDGQSEVSSPFDDVEQNLWIGFDPYTETRQFVGLIDEVRIWNTARTQADIKAAMGRPLTGNKPGLVGYWQFEALEDLGVGDDGADDVRDMSGNGNHG